MIFNNLPSDWKDLQDKVALILEQCGFKVESPKDLHSARSEIIEVDVYAIDETSILQQTVVCECKYWDKKVPQSVVHAFRMQVDDIGANVGLLISKNGFQSGAYSASRYSNIKLLTWEEFEIMFLPIWYKNYFLKEVANIGDVLIDYTEPINTRVFKKVELLAEEDKLKFRMLREKYSDLGWLCTVLKSDCYYSNQSSSTETGNFIRYCFPLADYVVGKNISCYSDDILCAKSYVQFLKGLKKNVDFAVKEFNVLFDRVVLP